MMLSRDVGAHLRKGYAAEGGKISNGIIFVLPRDVREPSKPVDAALLPGIHVWSERLGPYSDARYRVLITDVVMVIDDARHVVAEWIPFSAFSVVAGVHDGVITLRENSGRQTVITRDGLLMSLREYVLGRRLQSCHA